MRLQTALPAQTLSACGTADAVLLGAVGGPKWSDPKAKVRPEQGLLGAAQGAEPVREPASGHAASGAARRSPLKPEVLRGTDIMVVRELTGGIYFGEKRRTAGLRERLVHVQRRGNSARHARRGPSRARTPQVASCPSTRRTCWRPRACGARRSSQCLRAEFPDVEFEHMLVDSAAMHLIRKPSSFDVILTENMFGDILTDEASMLAGSLGLLPSASLGAGKLGVYEPIHGSAPDIAGQGIANPYATILSVAMLLRHSLDLQRRGAGGRKSRRGEHFCRRADGRYCGRRHRRHAPPKQAKP